VDGLAREWLRELRQADEKIIEFNHRQLNPPVVPTNLLVPQVDTRRRKLTRRAPVVVTTRKPMLAPRLLTGILDREDGGLNISLSEAYRNAMSIYRSIEFYDREVAKGKTPSARGYLDKFRRKVSTALPIAGSYENVSKDLSRKMAIYVTDAGITSRKEVVPGSQSTFFGLEQGEVVKERSLAPTLTVWA